MKRTTSTAALLGACAVAVAVAPAPLAIAHNAGGQIIGQNGEVVPDRFIVELSAASASSVRPTAQDLAAEYGGTVKFTFTHAMRGFSVTMPESAAGRLAADPAVSAVHAVHVAHAVDTQNNPPNWGDDRIDQAGLPLNNAYTYPNAGEGVTAYLVDTGVKASHADFEGRVSGGRDFVDNDSNPDDCNGHGTHTAGTVLGKAYGVAKKARGVPLRVLGCGGSGTSDQTVAAFDWVIQNARKPAVLNYSVTFVGGDAPADQAAQRVWNAGVVFNVAAGNDDKDACTYTPARVGDLITVGATTKADSRALKPDWGGQNASNYGRCLDIFAPGTGIKSAHIYVDSMDMSGTSMATPHVTGAAALYLSANPGATPKQVRDALVGNASPKVTNAGSGSPNGLLYVGFIGGGTPPPTGKAFRNDDDVQIADRATVESPVVVSGVAGNAPAGLKVAVAIKHTWRGDLVIDLVAPDGSAYRLKNASGNDSADDVNETYTVDASAETANGTWKLRVRDAYAGDTGFVDSWSLQF